MDAGLHRALRTPDNPCNFSNRQILQKMQDQNLTMLQPDFTQCLVKGRGICFRKRRLFGFLKISKLDLLSPFSGCIAANSIHGNSMRDRVQPRPQGTRVFQLPDVAERLDPNVLKNVQPTVRIAGQAGRVVEQRPLHHRDQILESALLARLASERKPFVPGSILTIHMCSLSMSNEKRSRFNVRSRTWPISKPPVCVGSIPACAILKVACLLPQPHWPSRGISARRIVSWLQKPHTSPLPNKEVLKAPTKPIRFQLRLHRVPDASAPPPSSVCAATAQ